MKNLFGSIWFAAFCFVLTTDASALILEGPEFHGNINGWANSGLSITALKDVTLENFVYVTYDQHPDTLKLTDNSGDVLYTHTYAGDPDYDDLPAVFYYTANVNWSLTAGQSYRLIKEYGWGGKYAIVETLPVANDHLQVNGAVDENGYVFDGVNIGPVNNTLPAYWFYFQDLTTETAAVPEPASMMLLGSGLLGTLWLRRRKK